MILTCPECATSYFVDDARIPDGGRTVKCTSCGNRWFASKDGAEPKDDPLEDVFADSAQPEPAPAPAAVRPVEVEDDLDVSGPPRRRRAPPPPAPKKPVGAILAWGVMAAVVAALIGGAIGFRDDVVRWAPNTSGAYAGIGLPANKLGLVIEQVKVAPTLQGGRPVLAVTGQIRNLRQASAEAPPIRIDMLNRAGKPVAAKILRPVNPHVPAGSLRHFAIAIADPPANIYDLALAFEAPTEARAQATHAKVPAEAALTPPPVEAQPLPSGSPDALEHHG